MRILDFDVKESHETYARNEKSKEIIECVTRVKKKRLAPSWKINLFY